MLRTVFIVVCTLGATFAGCLCTGPDRSEDSRPTRRPSSIAVSKIPAEPWPSDAALPEGERAQVASEDGRIAKMADGTIYEMRAETAGGTAFVSRAEDGSRSDVLARAYSVSCAGFIANTIFYVVRHKERGDLWGHRAWVDDLYFLSVDGKTHLGIADQAADCHELRANATHVYFTNGAGTWRVARDYLASH